ncbi:MAG: hypothetical protein M0R03_21930 [Novosphingobium sp.]|nr:hypothetical protein [Novosphingobium sp.]
MAKKKKIGSKLKKILRILLNVDESEVQRYYTSDFEDEMDEKYVFDLKGETFGFGVPMRSIGSAEEDTQSQKITKKPIEVLEELSQPPRILDFANLDDKIWLLKEKSELLRSNNWSKKQTEGLISCLENRKKFDPYFSQFSITTLEDIEILTGKYDLVMKEADLFIPEFPKEAIKIMKEYSAKVKEITGKKAIYYVIATEKDFKEADKKRDPILLAQSIFGFYYDILGAWDREMVLLSEL